MDQDESDRRLFTRQWIREGYRYLHAELEAYKKLSGWFVRPAGDKTGFDAAFGAMLPFCVFGAGLAFSTLYAAERAGAGSRGTQCLAWAFALYVCAAAYSLCLRLWITVMDLGDNVSMTIALLSSIIACIVGTMLMALSLHFNSQIWGVRVVGMIVAIAVGSVGLIELTVPVFRPFSDDWLYYSALRESRWALSKPSLRTASQLLHHPTEDLRAEIERFIHLYSQFGNAFTYLDRHGNENSEMAKFQKSHFQRLPREEMASRLAYAAMAFGNRTHTGVNGLLNEHLLEAAREFVAPEMRKWDAIIKQLVEQEGSENNWWGRPRLFRVLRMWWLFQAHGGADPAAKPLNAAGAVPGNPQPEAGTVDSIDYGDSRSMTWDAHGNIGDGASLRSEHPTRQTPRSSASSIRSLTSVRRDGQGFERQSMESPGREMLGQQQMPRNAGRISPLPRLSDSPV